MEKRQMTCINCPLGCQLEVEFDNQAILRITGYRCQRGIEYAKKELLSPTRTITSVVPVLNGDVPMVSVKTERDIPKNKITECMLAMKNIRVEAPIEIGDIVLSNVANTNINIIATKRVQKLK